MLLWSPDRRAQVIDFEIGSRLAFSSAPIDPSPAPPAQIMTVWHLNARRNVAGGLDANYQPLAQLVRPSEDTFFQQLEIVANYADLRADRTIEILAQMNGPSAFLASIAFVRPERTRWTLELLDAVFRLAQSVEMRAKHALACRRPLEYSPQVQPIIETPGHGSLPSGHSTESFALAAVMIRLLAAGANPVYNRSIYRIQLMRQAARVATNRQVAGVHFPVDSAAGAVLGLTLGEYINRRFTATFGNTYDAWKFDGQRYPADRDFVWGDFFDAAIDPGTQLQTNPAAYAVRVAQASPLGDRSAILEWLWEKAVAEWA